MTRRRPSRRQLAQWEAFLAGVGSVFDLGLAFGIADDDEFLPMDLRRDELKERDGELKP